MREVDPAGEMLPGFDGPRAVPPLDTYDEWRAPSPVVEDPMLTASRRRLLRMALVGGSWNHPWWVPAGGRRGGLLFAVVVLGVAGFVAFACVRALQRHGWDSVPPLVGLAVAVLVLGAGLREGWYAVRGLACWVRRSR